MFSTILKEHTLHLLENSLFVKAKKLEFHCSSDSFLGYVIVEGSLEMDSAKVAAVTEWLVPESQLCSFLQTINLELQHSGISPDCTHKLQSALCLDHRH